MAKHIHIHFRPRVARTRDDDGAAAKPRMAKLFENRHGIPISVETPKGGLRSGKDWSVTMPAHYGFIDGVPGADGDSLDMYLGPDPLSDQVYVVDQLTLDGDWDEHKCMLGFASKEAALKAYMAGHHASGDTFGRITALPMEMFKRWMAKGNLKQPCSRSAVFDAGFEESEHPRANDGRFGTKGLQKHAVPNHQGWKTAADYFEQVAKSPDLFPGIKKVTVTKVPAGAASRYGLGISASYNVGTGELQIQSDTRASQIVHELGHAIAHSKIGMLGFGGGKIPAKYAADIDGMLQEYKAARREGEAFSDYALKSEHEWFAEAVSRLVANDADVSKVKANLANHYMKREYPKTYKLITRILDD